MFTAIATPDNVTASALAARDLIGGAIASKIKDIRSISDMSVLAEEVLPEIEKFLESPEEKRLRRMRNGSTVSLIGIGASIAFSIGSFLGEKGLIVVAAAGLVTFFVGLALFLNGYFLTVPAEVVSDHTADAESQRKLDGEIGTGIEAELSFGEQKFHSVTDNTTRNLTK